MAVHPGDRDRGTIFPGHSGRYCTRRQLRWPIGQRRTAILNAVEYPLGIHIIVPRGKAAQGQSQRIRPNVGQGKIVWPFKPDLLWLHFSQSGKGFFADAAHILANH